MLRFNLKPAIGLFLFLLLNIGCDKTGNLIQQLNNDEAVVRANAARALGEAKNPRATQPLIEALSDSNSNVRKEVAKALGSLRDSLAVAPLIRVLNDSDDSVKVAAANSLINIGRPAVIILIQNLKNESESIRSWAGDILGRIKDERAISGLIANLGDADDYVQSSAESALVKIGKPVRPYLLNALHNRNSSIRKRAVRVLGAKKDSLVVEHLIAALKDEDWTVRSNAAEALVIQSDIRAAQPLIAALKDEDSSVRHNAARALSVIGDKRAVDSLISSLNDANAYVVEEAAAALGAIKDVRAIAPLISALETASSWNGNEVAGMSIEYSRSFRCNAIAKALSSFWPITSSHFKTFLNNNNKHVRAAAACGLGNTKDPSAVDYLIIALKDNYVRVRKCAIESLVSIGDKKVIPVLTHKLRDWNVGSQAAEALKGFGWHPISIQDSVHSWVANGQGYIVEERWNVSKTVLLDDIKSSDYFAIENALYSFIAIGRKEIISELIETLNDNGNKDMAEAYLNCGQMQLSEAARSWAYKNGYIIIKDSGKPLVEWGAWN